MLLDLARRFKDLFADIAAEGNAPDTPTVEEEERPLPLSGGYNCALTSFNQLRDAIPALHAFTPYQRGAVMTDREVAAWDMLQGHHFSRKSLQASGELEDYLSLGVSDELERLWRASYVRMLLEGYEEKPSGLKTVLAIATEYHDEGLMRRVIETLDDAITGERMDGLTLINSLKDCLDVGIFDKEQIMELLARAEYHLRSYDKGTEWRERLNSLRGRLEI